MRPTRHRSSRRSADKDRLGVAVIELAICLPILVLILVATIEACVMLQLKQNLIVTAYEGARIGILPGTDAEFFEPQTAAGNGFDGFRLDVAFGFDGRQQLRWSCREPARASLHF